MTSPLHAIPGRTKRLPPLRVGVGGPVGSGKTTLVEMLARRYETTWVPEYGREYWEHKVAGLSMDGPLPGWTSEEFITIAAEQQVRENMAARSANCLLFCDTNAWATGTWHERYMDHRDARVDAIGARDIVHLYLITEPDFPFVQDGWRDGHHIRDWMHGRFIAELSKQPAPAVRLKGPMESRIARAESAINDLLARPFDL